MRGETQKGCGASVKGRARRKLERELEKATGGFIKEGSRKEKENMAWGHYLGLKLNPWG